MNTKQKNLAASLLILSTLSCATAAAPAKIQEPPRLQLSAEASRETALDEMTVHLATEAEGPNPGALNQSVLRAANAALATAKRTPGVLAQLTSVSTQQVYGPRGVPTAWKVRALISVKGRDMPSIGALAGDLGKDMQVSGVEFSLSPTARAELEKKLTEDAAAALQQKALLAAKTLGFQGYALEEVSLQDQSTTGHRPAPMARGGVAMLAMSEGAGSAVPSDSGTTTITVRFSATARLLPTAQP